MAGFRRKRRGGCQCYFVNYLRRYAMEKAADHFPPLFPWLSILKAKRNDIGVQNKPPAIFLSCVRMAHVQHRLLLMDKVR